MGTSLSYQEGSMAIFGMTATGRLLNTARACWIAALLAFPTTWPLEVLADGSDTSHIDAPLWPLMLGGPLEAIAVDLQILGDAPSTTDRGNLERDCATYLRQALGADSDIHVVTYTDLLLKRLGHNYRTWVVVHYKVTLKNWPNGNRPATALLGAVELDIEHPWRRIPQVATYSPTELFQSPLDAESVSRAMTDIVRFQMDRFVISPVKRAYSR
jgi:hypothetical protein